MKRNAQKSYLLPLLALVVSVAFSAAAQAPAAPPAPVPPAAPTAGVPPVPAPVPPAPVDPNAPKITCAEPIFDFGQADNTAKVEHDYKVRNDGKSQLLIKDVKASCGCTAVTPAKTELAPGEETTIKAVLNLENKQGAQSKTITVNSNDPSTPRLVLSLKGIAVPMISVTPPVVSFDTVTDTTHPALKTVEVRAVKEGLTFAVKEAKVAAGSWQCTTEVKEVEPGRAYQVTVISPAGLGEGSYHAQLVVTTDSKECPEVKATCNMRILGPYQVSPKSIVINLAGGPVKTGRIIQVQEGQAKNFEVTEVIPPTPDIKWSIDAKRGTTSIIRLTEIPCSEAIVGKELIIKTNNAEHPEIRIPFQKQTAPMLPPNIKNRARMVPGTMSGVPPMLQRPPAPPQGVPVTPVTPAPVAPASPAAPANTVPEAAPAK